MPTLNVAGWFDQEDFYGPMQAYTKLEKSDKNKMNYIVVGPWNHGGWGGPGDKLGNLELRVPRTYFREKVQAPWFAYHLKGKGSSNFPKRSCFKRAATNGRRTANGRQRI